MSNNSYFRFTVISVTMVDMQEVLMSLIQSSSFKGSLLHVNTRFVERSKFVNKDLTFHLLQENILSFNVGIYFRANNFLFPSFNKFITTFIENGIIHRNIDFIVHRAYLTAPKKSTLVVLTMGHLSVGFQIWSSCCCCR